MTRYKHTQIGYFLVISYSIVTVVMVYITITTGFHAITLAGLIFMLFVLGSLPFLTVAVGDQMIEIRFGMGMIRKAGFSESPVSPQLNWG